MCPFSHPLFPRAGCGPGGAGAGGGPGEPAHRPSPAVAPPTQKAAVAATAAGPERSLLPVPPPRRARTAIVIVTEALRAAGQPRGGGPDGGGSGGSGQSTAGTQSARRGHTQSARRGHRAPGRQRIHLAAGAAVLRARGLEDARSGAGRSDLSPPPPPGTLSGLLVFNKSRVKNKAAVRLPPGPPSSSHAERNAKTHLTLNAANERY